jgi:hypothetical protein
MKLNNLIALAAVLLAVLIAKKAKAKTITGIMVPLYVAPGPLWNEVIAQKSSHPNVPIAVILNNNNGPGSAYDASWAAGIAQMRAAGIIVLGYVFCSYPDTDVNKWKEFYPAVNGLFIDGYHGGYAGDTGDAKIAIARQLGFSPIVGNPGMNIDESLLANLDIACVHESNTYPNAEALASQHGASKVYLLIYGQGLNTPWLLANAKYFKWIYLTDDLTSDTNYWDSLASYFAAEVAALDAGIIPTVANLTANSVSPSSGVELWFDYAYIGTTPITIDVSPGVHHIGFNYYDYSIPGWVLVEGDITIVASEHKVITADMANKILI